MTNRPFKITDATSGAAFTVRVVTRCAKTEAVGVQEDGSLRIRLTSQAAGEPDANSELLTFLSSELGVALNKIEIVAGERERDKLISVEGVSTQMINEKFGKPIAE
ncbi:MAG TPA: DUF167 domain-containing protein [Aggregatilineales bacterium]|nr:DUF167 domain-containing protein [Aggregatilineales bacterium]